jgi:hypothetical protein
VSEGATGIGASELATDVAVLRVLPLAEDGVDAEVALTEAAEPAA